MSARWFIARHGETVFNAAGRMQGDTPHTPLTRAGFAQADDMGAALGCLLGSGPALTLWASPAGRALQTLAIIAEHLELDWHAARTDPRLREIDIGEWSGLYHRDIAAREAPIVVPGLGLFGQRPPGGEWYDEIAERLRTWINDTAGEPGDRLIVMHGMSSRILRGLLTGAPIHPAFGAPVAPSIAQGALVEISGGTERLVAANRDDFDAD